MDKLTIKTENIVLKLNTGSIIVSGGNVQSVNGRTGNITLNANDVGAATPQDVADLRDYTDTQFTAVSNQINQLNIKTDTTNSDLAALSSQVVNLAIDVSENIDSISGLTITVETHTTQIGELNTGVGQLYEGMTTFQSEITDLQNNKLDASAYVQHFKGLFPSYAALTAAYPVAEDGDYAHIDSGSGFDRMAAIWDSSDVKWVVQGTDVGANTDEVPEGSQNFYFTNARAIQAPLSLLTLGDGSQLTSTDSVIGGFGKLQTQFNGVQNNVRETILAGFSPINSSVVFTDTLITGMSKLQGQISDLLNTFGSKVQQTVLTNYSIGLNTPVVNTDTLVVTIGKLQSQITNIAPTVRSTTLTGFSSSTGTVSAADSIVTAFGKLQNQSTVNSTSISNLNTDLENRVRQTPLAFIDTTPTTTAISGLDTVITGMGKLQGQVTTLKTPTWVSVKTLTGIAWHGGVDVANSTIEVAKIGGMLWVRGWLRNTGTLFSTVPLVSWTQASWLIDVTGMGYGSAYGHFAGGVVAMHSSNDTGYYRVTVRQGQNLIYNGLYLALDSAISSVGILPILPMCLGKAF